MSRVLKSSQIILDNNMYKITFEESAIKTQTINNDTAQNSEEKLRKMYDEIEHLKKNKLLEAKKEAEKIISDAYEKAKIIMEQARMEGFDEGKKQGFEEGKQYADEIIKEALSIKEEIIHSKKKLIKNIEEDVINLTIRTIEKILNKKIDEDYDIIYGLIQSGLEKCAFTDNLILRVSPDDYEFVWQIKDKILALSENITDIIIKQDKSLNKGSCIIDTSSGSVDSSIWTQFNQVKETFEEILKGE